MILLWLKHLILSKRGAPLLCGLTKLVRLATQNVIPNRRCKSDVAKLSERLKKGLKALESLLDERDVFAIPARRETLAVGHKSPKNPDEKLAPVAEDDEVEAPASAKDYPLWTKRYVGGQNEANSQTSSCFDVISCPRPCKCACGTFLVELATQCALCCSFLMRAPISEENIFVGASALRLHTLSCKEVFSHWRKLVQCAGAPAISVLFLILTKRLNMPSKYLCNFVLTSAMNDPPLSMPCFQTKPSIVARTGCQRV
jgi:hypothetical protein